MALSTPISAITRIVVRATANGWAGGQLGRDQDRADEGGSKG